MSRWVSMRDIFRISTTRLMLSICIFQIAGYWYSGAMSNCEGVLSIPQPDTPLYYQAARRIVEGHPFSYSEGSAVCTGTTTVLYPFLLAIPYALGFTGDSMIVIGFLLNAIFYLVFLLCWAKAIEGWCDREDVRVLTSLIIALSGHCAFAVFSQTDIGFWLAFSGLFALALSRRYIWLAGILLAFASWVRPEGVILVISFAVVTALFYLCRKDKEMCPLFWAVIIGAFSACGVFALNYMLTGNAQFASISGKGHFATLSFPAAVMASISDLFTTMKCAILGLSPGMPRDLLAMPLFGGFLLMAGLVGYRWSRDNMHGLLVFLLAAAGGLANVAQSGMQGTNMERYLVWIFPIFAFFTANGLVLIEDRLPRLVRRLPSAIVLSFCLLGCIYCHCSFHQACAYVDSGRMFAKDCDLVMPKGASVGGFPCAPAYFMSPRRFAHLTGVYSPEFAPQDVPENIERLRNKPNLRFDYWLVCSDLISLLGTKGVGMLGDAVLPGPCGMTLMKADWGAFDSVSTAALNDELSLVAKVDVGYEADESSAKYNIITRWGYPVFDPFVQFGRLGEKEVVDVGRVILGGDEMSVPLKPGRDAVVVARFWPRHSVVRSTAIASNVIDCALANPLRLNVSVDGSVVNLAEIPYSENGFSDVSFKIPGVAIKNEVSRIGFLGDHIVFAYWFYQ